MLDIIADYIKTIKLPGRSSIRISYQPEYIDSYFIIGGGIILITLGIYWAFRLYTQSRKEDNLISFESVNHQIAINIQKAASPLVRPVDFQTPRPDSSPAAGDTTALLIDGLSQETIYLTSADTPTVLLANNTTKDPHENKARETQLLVEE